MNIKDEFEKRMNDRPDAWTLSWWDEQFKDLLKAYRGATHAINRSIADYHGANSAIEEIRQRCEALERGRQEDRAKMGEMQTRVERMAEFLNQLKQAK